jgi:hypothetical protein
LDEYCRLTGKEGPPHSPHKQKSWDCETSKKKFDEMLNEASEFSKTRLQAVSEKYASVWINALPSKNIGTFLNCEEIRVAMSLRFGLKLFTDHRCKCGETCDGYGKHSFLCKKNNGRHIRHNSVNEHLHRTLTSVNLTNVREPSSLLNCANRRPDGVTMLPYKFGKPLVWDYTCPHTLAPSYAGRKPAETLEMAESKKLKKYESLKENYYFIPIAISTFGGYGPQALKFIREISYRLQLKFQDARAGHHFRQQLAICSVKGNAKTVLYSLAD